ncbi:MAG: hypothetical protein KC897_02305 [Candidatus Omnitrophica bacterium]|nr:hypothetical protein [Candidatus Omnitrophota bacterium]MCB9721064.1 hypothetical protein [Candidatus Omnitrophota bacterium]
MRRTTSLFVALSLLLGGTALAGIGSDATARTSQERLELARFLKAQNIHSLPEYVKWFEQHMTYRPDGQRDNWARPLDTLLRQGGDCEDLAFLNKAMIALFGIEGRVLGTRRGDEHHVFLVFEYAGRIFIFDNTRCIRTKAHSLDDIAAFLYRKYEIDYVLEVENSPRHIRVLYDSFTLRGYARGPLPVPAS